MKGLKALLFSIAIFCFFCGYAQDQPKADSLIKVLVTKSLPDSSRLLILYAIARDSPSPDAQIKYAEEVLRIAKELGNKLYATRAYLSIGTAYRLKGDLDQAMGFLIESGGRAEEYGFQMELAGSYMEISTIFTANSDYDNALLYNNKAIEILRDIGSNRSLAFTLINTGFDYYTSKRYDTALLYYDEALPILDSLDENLGLAYVIGNRALVKWKTGDITNAIIDLNDAVKRLQPLGDEYAMADYHNQLGNIYFELGDLNQAASNLSTGVSMAKRNDLKEQVRDASKLLSEIYRKESQTDSAYHYLYQYLALRDSIADEEVTRELANQRADFEIGLKQAEVEVLELKQRNQQIIIWAVVGFSVFLFISATQYQRYRTKKRLERRAIDQRMAELKALKAQINPHFLFNALNSIQSYILDDERDVAEMYLVKYGKLMRKILDYSNELIVPLYEELEALKLYVDLEQLRLGQSFDYNVCLGEGVDPYETQVPAMVIQPFIENAIWHGVSKLDTKGIIQLSVEQKEDFVEVRITDNGPGFEKVRQAGTGHSSKGIHLVEERLSLLKASAGEHSVLEVASEVGKGTEVTIRFSSELA